MTTIERHWLTKIIAALFRQISIPLAQFAMQLPEKAILARKLIRIFHLAADVLLCIHFTLDPYIYVLLRMPRPRFRLLKPLCKICWPARSRSSSFNGESGQSETQLSYLEEMGTISHASGTERVEIWDWSCAIFISIQYYTVLINNILAIYNI